MKSDTILLGALIIGGAYFLSKSISPLPADATDEAKSNFAQYVGSGGSGNTGGVVANPSQGGQSSKPATPLSSSSPPPPPADNGGTPYIDPLPVGASAEAQENFKQYIESGMGRVK